VTLHCGSGQWRVAYSLLHRVVDAGEQMADVIELGASPAPMGEESPS